MKILRFESLSFFFLDRTCSLSESEIKVEALPEVDDASVESKLRCDDGNDDCFRGVKKETVDDFDDDLFGSHK